MKIILREPSPKGPPSFEFAPFIDIVFTLLIFFAVTTTLGVQEKALDLDLPTAESTVDQMPGIVVSIDSSRVVFVDGQEVEMAQLQETIAALIQNKPEAVFIFRADKTVPYDTVISALDKTRLGGAGKLFLEAVVPSQNE